MSILIVIYDIPLDLQNIASSLSKDKIQMWKPQEIFREDHYLGLDIARGIKWLHFLCVRAQALSAESFPLKEDVLQTSLEWTHNDDRC